MTRMQKWAYKRAQIETENMQMMFKDYQLYLYIRMHQKEVKEEMGCKH